MSFIDLTQLPSVEADAIYAVGDVHGRLDLLEEIEQMIVADIASSGGSKPVICYLGDYVDRGPHSAGVIDRLTSHTQDGMERIYLKGNHEDRMLAFLENPHECGPAWAKFGGREALESYGVHLPDAGQEDWGRIYDEFRALLPERHLRFLNQLRLAARWRDFLFVHAGLSPLADLAQQPARDLIWIRDAFINSSRDWGVRVIHGHVIVEEVAFRPNRIGIDTGAYKSGVLTCLVVAPDKLRILQTAPESRPA